MTWRSRRVVAVAGVALAAGLAACGSNGATDSGESEASGGQSYTISHHKGKTELPAEPQRVVALDPSLVEAVAAIDQDRLAGGIGTYDEEQSFPSYLGDSVAGVEWVGPLDSPNLEAITALKPDLIVSASIRHEDVYDELSKIAPTVFVETTGPTWKDNITKVAEAMGAEDTAETKLEEYEQRAASLGKAINEKAGDPEISVVRFMDGPTRLVGHDSFTGIILKDMGLARPTAQDIDEFALEVGEEQIRKADGDYIFVSAYEGGEPSQEQFQRNPLWRKLDGVKAGNVHEVNDATWMMSVSLQGAHFMLDDMAEIFDVDPMRS
ncbi:MAG: ABC transporter substrate-binding protein [Actinophytocola sp.]|nr:ABC transporter substrate-binding protein [Actinophytocola sp.]